MKALASHNPSCMYLCSRKIPAAQALIDTIHEQHTDVNIVPLQLDLSSFDSIKSCAAEFNSKSDRLDLLFLNAGIAGTAPNLTKEGFETQFGVNHMGHAMLAQLLMPKLLATQKQAGADVRIMITSSIAPYTFGPKGGLQLEKMKTTADDMQSMVRYGHSKLANSLFAKKLAQVYPDITTTSHHPGTVDTEIFGKSDGVHALLLMMAKPYVYLTSVSADKGAESGLWTAVVDKSKLKNGGYYEPVGTFKVSAVECDPSACQTFTNPYPLIVQERNKNITDQKQIDALWEWTNKELAQLGGPGWPEV